MEMIKKRNTPVTKDEILEIVNEIKYKLYHYNIKLEDLWKVILCLLIKLEIQHIFLLIFIETHFFY